MPLNDQLAIGGGAGYLIIGSPGGGAQIVPEGGNEGVGAGVIAGDGRVAVAAGGGAKVDDAVGTDIQIGVVNAVVVESKGDRPGVAVVRETQCRAGGADAVVVKEDVASARLLEVSFVAPV